MKAKGKKLVALFIWFSFIAMSQDVLAKNKGAELLVEKGDNQRLRGELFAVKENSLLFLSYDSSTPLLVDIRVVKNLRIVKKSHMLEGAIIGVILGGIVGGRIGLEVMKDGGNGTYEVLGYGAVGAGLGLFIGQTAGLALGKEKIFHVEAMSEPEVKKLLKKLRSNARFPDYE